jgi:uncharacterized membrane protein
MPIIDSKNKKHVNLMINELRMLKKYPVAYDFLANVIDKTKDNIGHYIKDVGRDYYELNLSQNIFDEYIADCGDHNIRKSIEKQLKAEMTSGFVLIKGKDFVRYQAPFRIMGAKKQSNGKIIYQIFY